MGPRKGVFFRLAKTRPLPGVEEEAAERGTEKADSLNGEARTKRMLEGKALMVGVAGRTLTEVWGERAERPPPVLEGKAEECTLLEFEEIEEALECVCA